jgi:SecD/SecF fusion protein
MGEIAFFITTISVLVLPFILAWFIAKALKVQEWTSRIAVVMFTLAVGASPFLTAIMTGQSIEDRFRLGIDLDGGTNMVFQVKPEGKEITNEVMDRMVGAVSQRINQSGTEEITVRRVGEDRIEVIVPGEDPQTVDEIKRKITRLGSLEFFICADETDQDIVRQARELDLSQTELRLDGELVAHWVPAFERDGVTKLLDNDAIRREVQKTREVKGKLENYQTEEYLLLVQPEDERVTGKYLRSATPDFGENGSIVVSFIFDQNGGYLFGQLTGRNAPKPGRPDRKLAIVLDRMVFSAPNINEQITTRGQISGGSGGFTRAEADELSNVLNAGALEVPIDQKPLSEATVDPTLGADVRSKGVTATAISGVAVVIFMLAYYRASGLVAVISLMLNLLLTISAMVAINATFTLPGIAGIVLTIGMAVDANVLIYERMREELGKGSSVRMAINNGFEKAFITIFDSNLTTLLTAVILFVIGTDQIKGFAVTLFIGLAVSMYTALFVGRLFFDIAEKRRWLTELKMTQMVGETNLDFLKYRKFCATCSIAVIAIGMAVFMSRGDKNYDIDFTGGTMVSFQMTEPQKTEDVQAALKKEFGDEFSLERLTLGEETTEGVGTYFRLRSTDRDEHDDAKKDASSADSSASTDKSDDELSAEERVRNKVNAAFAASDSMKLRMVSLDFTDVRPVTIDDGDVSPEARSRMRFKGGSESELTFSEEVASGTASDLLARALAEIREDGNEKYKDVESLFGFEGTEGSGTNAAERSVRKFSKLVARVSPAVAPEDFATALSGIREQLSSTPLFDEVNTFASAVASEMKQRAVIAVFVSILAISAYIWFRFQNMVFGLAAIVALVHDVLVTLAVVTVSSMVSGTTFGKLLAFDDFRLNLTMIAAFLTLVGYSLNDTIVLFDRIREVRGKNPAITTAMVNLSLNQTLARTLLTGTTVMIVVLIMYIFGGAGLHGFAWCLFVGCVVGTYSSIYIAAPILVWAMDRVQGSVKAR